MKILWCLFSFAFYGQWEYYRATDFEIAATMLRVELFASLKIYKSQLINSDIYICIDLFSLAYCGIVSDSIVQHLKPNKVQYS